MSIFYSGLGSKNYRQVHWRRLANVQEGWLKISRKWLRKQLGFQGIIKRKTQNYATQPKAVSFSWDVGRCDPRCMFWMCF